MSLIDLRYGKWCVYDHIVNEAIVYVGVGGSDRPFSISRHRSWKSFMLAAGSYSVRIVKWFHDRKDADEFEKSRIAYFKPLLNRAGNASKIVCEEVKPTDGFNNQSLLARFPDTKSCADFLGVPVTCLYDWLRQDSLPRNCRDRAVTAFVDAGLSIPESWMPKRRRLAREAK